MRKHRSVVLDKIRLEIGLGKKSVYRHKQNTLRNLVLSQQRHYRKIRKFIKKFGKVSYEAGTGLIFNFIPRDKRMECYQAFIWKIDPKPHYSMQITSCYDIEAWQESTNRVLINKGHRASIFMLQKNGYLLRSDLRTGDILDEVYLPPKYKFVEITEDREIGYLFLKSAICGKSHEDVISAIIILSFPHLEFVAFFEVKRSIFGKSAFKVEICQGIMIIFHTNNKMKLYSLKDILKEFSVSHFNFGDTFFQDNTYCCVGKNPYGLPITVNITETPVVLLEIGSVRHRLQIGGNPWHFITCPSEGKFQVCDMKEMKAVEGGPLLESDSLEDDIVVFHPDESLKIVHSTSSNIVIYEVTQGPIPKLQPFFSLDAFDQKNLERSQKRQISSFGRKLTQPIYYGDDKSSLVCFDYEDELDLFALLVVREDEGDEPELEIILTDARSGEILRREKLPDCLWPKIKDSIYSFEIDGPLLIVNVKNYNGNSKMFVFLMNYRKDLQVM